MKLKLTCILLSAAATFLISCAPPQSAPPMTPKVTVVQPRFGTVTNWDEYPAHLEAVESVEVRPKVAGYIDSIHFQDGADVQAGDLLFVIDPRPFQADLEHAQSERLRAETRLDLARNDFNRAENLKGTKAISAEELDTRTQAVREAEAALAATKAAETLAKLNLEYCNVKSPISGRIGQRLVTKGNLVQGGGMMPGTLLATVVSLDPVYCTFNADEMAFNRYRARRVAASSTPAPLPCDLALVGDAGWPHHGQLDFFNNQVDPQTGTIQLRATFSNPDRLLLPGMFAKVRVLADPPQEAMLIPAVAVGSDQGRNYALLVNSQGVVEPRPIEAGQQHGSLRVVKKGLQPEDHVIVNGLMMARPGAKVEVVQGETNNPNGPATAR